jgi:hypothetical protein
VVQRVVTHLLILICQVPAPGSSLGANGQSASIKHLRVDRRWAFLSNCRLQMSQVPFDRSSTHGLEINEARTALSAKNVEPVRRTMQHIANAPARSQDFERTQESLSIGITQCWGEKWVMKPSHDEV